MSDFEKKLANFFGQGDAVEFANKLSNEVYPGEGHLKRGDALRHMLWQAKLQQQYGSIPAALAGHVYELAGAMQGQEGNEQEMDLHNNEIGRRIGKESKNDADLVGKALQEIVEGRAKHYAGGGAVDSALSDYSQLLDAYPNARKFLSSLGANIEQHIPTQDVLQSPEKLSEWSQAAALNAPMGLIFAGQKAANAPIEKFAQANQLAKESGLLGEKVGSIPWMQKNKDIWGQTGIHYGYDMKPRFEISDTPFKLNTQEDFQNIIDQANANMQAMTEEAKAIRQAKKEQNPQVDLFEKELAKSRNERLKDIKNQIETTEKDLDKEYGAYWGARGARTNLDIGIQHPELLRAYPQIGEDIRIGYFPEYGEGGKFYNNQIDIYGLPETETSRSTGIHELQHAIQHIEDMNLGGNPEAAPYIHHEAARRALEKVPAKTRINANKADLIMSELSPLRKVSYIHDLENIARPKDLFNTQSYLINSDKLRDIIGSPPRYGSKLPYAQEAGKVLARIELENLPYDAANLYKSGVSREEIKRQINNLNAQLNRRWDDWRTYSQLARDVRETNPNLKNFTKDEAFDMYQRLAGEAEARAVQKRLNYTPEKRASIFPLEDYDVKNPLVHNFEKIRAPSPFAKGGSIDSNVLSKIKKALDEQNFEPDDSLIASTILHPVTAAKKASDWLEKQVNRAANIPDEYDNPNPLAGYTPEQQAEGALNLAGLMQTGAMPFAPESAGGVLGTLAIPKKRITVNDPVRVAYPEIYDRPDEIARRAAQNVSEEDPALKRLFGVTRDDLYELRKSRPEGNEQPNLVMPANPKGAKVAPQIMTRRNAQRIIDTLSEAEKYPELYKGMDAWYEMGPLFERYKEISDDPVNDFKRFQIFTGMASPGSDVLTEINRGSAALNLDNLGKFEDFLKHAGKPFHARQSQEFPEYLAGVMGHPYHSTAHGNPMSKYVYSGNVEMDSPKVPLYIQSAGVPETGYQTLLPVGDAHWSRGVGLGDVRTSKDYGASVSMPELLSLGPWWREKIAKPLGTNAVNAQARAWGTFAPATGVDTPVGAPKLELIAQKIMDAAHAYGISPEEARDLLLMGKIYAPNVNLLNMYKKHQLENAPSLFAEGGSVSTDSTDSALSDYAQLLEAYPNAKKFLTSLGKNVEAITPTQSQMSSPETALETALNFAPMGMAGVIKPKGGNWSKGSIDEDMDAYIYDIHGDTKNWADILQRLKSQYTPEEQQTYGSVRDSLNLATQRAALDDWLKTKFAKYVQNEMGTPEDPVRALADRGILHINPQDESWVSNRAQAMRGYSKYPFEPMATTELGKRWEDIADASIQPYRAKEIKTMDDGLYAERNQWLDKVDPESPVYMSGVIRDAGINHLVDELRNAIRHDSDLPANLRLDPSKLSKVSVPQAVELVDKINKYREAHKAESNAILARNPATHLHKEYPDQGYSWVELKHTPISQEERAAKGYLSDFDPNVKALEEALRYEGDTMGHCVGGYCPDVISGKSRIFSLRDAKGEPHVTIETRPRFTSDHSRLDEKDLEDLGRILWSDEQLPESIVQIKGKSNRMPKEEYLPFVQDFVRSRKWSDIGDVANTGLSLEEINSLINNAPTGYAEGGRIDKDSLPLNKPRRTPNHPTKSHVVKTMVDGKEKIIRFGEQGAVTAGKPKEGESEAMKAKRAAFKARHAKNIAKGPSSAAYWADKVKWADGGSVDIDHDHINSIIEAFNSEYGLRPDNTEKGRGYLNELKRPDGAVMTEFSIGVPIEGREMDIPTLVPTLTIDEIKSILSMPESGKIPRSIVQKAQEHAINRVKQGKSVFATPEESEFGER